MKPDWVVQAEEDYEVLEAECDALRAKTSLSLGVGDGTGNLFVHGDYDSIKRVQALIFECEKLRKDAERYRHIREECDMSDYKLVPVKPRRRREGVRYD